MTLVATNPNGTPVTPVKPPGGFSPQGQEWPGGTSTSPANQDAYQYLLSLFTSYGLGSLAPVILGYVQQSYSSDTISLMLQQTQEWKTRFAGNEARGKAGLPVLSPAEYLSTESAYRSVMSAAGMPPGFYDDPSDFAGYIGQGKSPTEINDRVQGYLTAAKNQDPAYRQMMKDEFGVNVSDGDIAAFMLDSSKALPLIQKTVDAIGISNAARTQGLASSADRSLSLAEQGVTGASAASAFGQIAQATHDYTNAAAATGLNYSQTDAENEALLGLDSARRKRQQIDNSFAADNTHQASRAINTPTSGNSY